MDEFDNRDFRGDVFSKVVKAGKRTYFFDIKETRSNDFYLIITESKKRVDHGGRMSFEKHKMFLYPEDFENFGNAFHEVVDLIEKRRNNEITDDDFERMRQEQLRQAEAAHDDEEMFF
ncbi:MAG: PUR family DNA/RNA-binding protein [Bacteroidales bacterium]|nr:PUR family DNA/RNA-binding protein [Bacteroidales bacterium]